jgi:D-lactate dehydrogenase (cytochrome)
VIEASPDNESLSSFNHDWTHKYVGNSRLVLQPSSAEEASAILKYCNDRRLAVVPQGGNTGLVGGGVPVFDEIIVSLSKMNRIIGFDESGPGVIELEAGCILEVADQRAKEHGHMMPLDLGAKGSCQVGGNLATNAGGIRLIRYGTMYGNTLGIQAVLANGQIINGLSHNRKDNTGYGVRNLFIGSEGTLGIITAATILCPIAPRAVNAALFCVKAYDDVVNILRRAKDQLGEILSAFEFWDTGSARLLAKHQIGSSPFPSEQECFYVLLETHGSDQGHDQEKISRLLEDLTEADLIVDGAVAQDQGQINDFWSLREGIPEACSKEGLVLKYDVTIPPSNLYGIVQDMRARLSGMPEASSVIGYGHVGDGNIHLNIATGKATPKLMGLIEPYVYEWVASKQGSVSAEHGVGVMKVPYLGLSKDAGSIDLMRALKRTMDPRGILNPYKVLPR